MFPFPCLFRNRPRPAGLLPPHHRNPAMVLPRPALPSLAALLLLLLLLLLLMVMVMAPLPSLAMAVGPDSSSQGGTAGASQVADASTPPLREVARPSLSAPSPSHTIPRPPGPVQPNPDLRYIVALKDPEGRIRGIWLTGDSRDVGSSCRQALKALNAQSHVPAQTIRTCRADGVRSIVSRVAQGSRPRFGNASGRLMYFGSTQPQPHTGSRRPALRSSARGIPNPYEAWRQRNDSGHLVVVRDQAGRFQGLHLAGRPQYKLSGDCLWGLNQARKQKQIPRWLPSLCRVGSTIRTVTLDDRGRMAEGTMSVSPAAASAPSAAGATQAELASALDPIAASRFSPEPPSAGRLPTSPQVTTALKAGKLVVVRRRDGRFLSAHLPDWRRSDHRFRRCLSYLQAYPTRRQPPKECAAVPLVTVEP